MLPQGLPPCRACVEETERAVSQRSQEEGGLRGPQDKVRKEPLDLAM